MLLLENRSAILNIYSTSENNLILKKHNFQPTLSNYYYYVNTIGFVILCYIVHTPSKVINP